MVTLVSGPPEEVVDALLRGDDEVIHAVDPSTELLTAIIDGMGSTDDPPVIRVLARREALKAATGDFIVTTHAADLVAADVLEIRTGSPDPGTELFASERRVAALVTAGGTVGALTTADDDFVETVNAAYETAWAAADPFPLRTPPLSRIQRTLGEDIGPEAQADFDAILASLESARGGGGNGLDEVTISLLVAARNEELLYDISKWGEDAGIASKATFSRTKTELEEMGLLDTEKVPIDVGRPRLRLKFAHPRLAEASIDELASVARALLDA